MNNLILIIDGNNLFFRYCSYLAKKNEKFLENDGDDSMLMSSVYNNIRNAIRELKLSPSTIYYVTDHANKWRDDINGGVAYKKTRKYSELFNHDKLKSTISKFGYLSSQRYGWTYCNVDGFEGDDLIFLIGSHHFKAGDTVIIMSSDGDMKQMISYNNDLKNHITIYDTQSDKMICHVHQNMKKAITNPIGEFNNIFDDDNDGVIDSILKGKYDEINPAEVAFIKIIGGDVGDNVQSVYSKLSSKGKPISFGNGFAKSLYALKQYDFDFIIQMYNDESSRRMIASEILKHMKSNELGRLSEISDNIRRNMTYVFLNHIIYNDEQRNNVVGLVEPGNKPNNELKSFLNNKDNKF